MVSASNEKSNGSPIRFPALAPRGPKHYLESTLAIKHTFPHWHDGENAWYSTKAIRDEDDKWPVEYVATYRIPDTDVNAAQLAHDARMDRLQAQANEFMNRATYGQQQAQPARGTWTGDVSAAEHKGRSGPFQFMSSSKFACGEFQQEWIVKRLLVKNQPGICGGPKKSLKTSLLVDLAISLGTGTPFLGHFDVYRKMKVGVMSGESGQATLHETAQRACRAKGVRLEDALVNWEFQLPQLASKADLGELMAAISTNRFEVLVIDPLYLCALGGMKGQGNAAANLYVMGPLLANVTQTCLSVGCTPILAHHFKLTRQDAFAEPQLEDLAFSGVQEYARQWLLVGRRQKYEPGSGSHQLWLTAGGSAGQGGLWHLDVEEGVMNEDFSGRRWDVTVTSSTEATKAAGSEKAEEKRRRDREDDDDLMAALDRIDPTQRGCGLQKVIDESGLSRARVQRAATRLKAEGLIEEVPVSVTIGKGGNRTVDGLRRTRGDGE